MIMIQCRTIVDFNFLDKGQGDKDKEVNNTKDKDILYEHTEDKDIVYEYKEDQDTYRVGIYRG